MSLSPRRRVTPADLVSLATRLQEDEQRPRAKLLKRDAELARSLAQDDRGRDRPEALLLWWLHATEPEGSAQASNSVRSALGFAGVGVVLLGLLMGWVLALGVFRYDGEQPVNVVWVLGIFVFLQGLTLALALAAAMPRPLQRLSAMLGLGSASLALQDSLKLVSPGRLALVLARLMPQEMREALQTAVGASGAHQRLFSRVQLWSFIRWSQMFALSLNTAAALTFIFLVFFTDLAFGWGTTLAIDARGFHQMTTRVSVPWAWLETAVPSAALVENSRYFRGTEFIPEARGAWWPFILMSMLLYGCLPRLVFTLIAHRALARACQEALVQMPGVSALLRRLQTPVGPGLSPGEDVDAMDSPAWSLEQVGQEPVVVNWAGAVVSQAAAALALGRGVEHLYHAGGALSVEDETKMLRSIGEVFSSQPPASSSAPPSGVVVLIKLWEPPVIEATEFLRSLRNSVGDGVPVLVWPIIEDHAEQIVSRDPVLREQWLGRVKAMGDPWIQVAPIPAAPDAKGGRDDA